MTRPRDSAQRVRCASQLRDITTRSSRTDSDAHEPAAAVGDRSPTIHVKYRAEFRAAATLPGVIVVDNGREFQCRTWIDALLTGNLLKPPSDSDGGGHVH